MYATGMFDILEGTTGRVMLGFCLTNKLYNASKLREKYKERKTKNS